MINTHQRSKKASRNSHFFLLTNWDTHKLAILFYTHINTLPIDRPWLEVIFVSPLYPLLNFPSSNGEPMLVLERQHRLTNEDVSQKGWLNPQSCELYLSQEFVEDKDMETQRPLGLIVIINKYLSKVCCTANIWLDPKEQSRQSLLNWYTMGTMQTDKCSIW